MNKYFEFVIANKKDTIVICNAFEADLGERLLRPLWVAAMRLADVTEGQRHVLQGEITERQRRPVSRIPSKYETLLS